MMTSLQILGTIKRDEFVGRNGELRAVVDQAWAQRGKNGLMLPAAPGVGAGELLRQAYDQLFMRRGDPVPIHFAFKASDDGGREVASRFFQNLLQQFVAYRRVDPALSNAPLSLHELVDLALPGDYETISDLVESFERERARLEQGDFIRFCVNASHRLSRSGRSVYYLLNALSLTTPEQVAFGRELVNGLKRSDANYSFTALRRQLTDLIHGPDNQPEAHSTIQVDRLNDTDAVRLVEFLAHHHQIETAAPVRDLIVQQLNASPVLINELFLAAGETKTPLTSFLDCQRLYVDELMGGRIHRHFGRMLDAIAPAPQARKTLLRVLHETALTESHKASLWAWKKRLGVDPREFEPIIGTLHINEMANASGAFIEINTDSYVWMDYLGMRHRLEVKGEPRALVVASTLMETLKRAPHAMAKRYRHEAALGVRELLSGFDCQNVPAILFHYDRFAAAHKGKDPETIDLALESESELIRLPQVVFASACSNYAPVKGCESARCAIGHGFEAAEYSDENEVVWIAAEFDSKLEASRELTAEWCDRLAVLASQLSLGHVRFWLIAPEGFDAAASDFLNERGIYGSSRGQVELLSARIETKAEPKAESPSDEFEMTIPMGDDTELIAAHTVEQIARRVNFAPEAINQIKTAVVEACINAAEHSLSPDRKIYQRFRLENDKLVVIVASRGVVPANLEAANGEGSAPGQNEFTKSRRGWGLKLIKTLMDEVEFERVDDGTQLRMTKYIR
jgi:serine/threonine-protein kinase RsbW